MFFREPRAFDVLAAKVLLHLIPVASAESPLRVWVPACATGEEAYSIAICCLEQFRRMRRPPHLRVLATDADLSAVAIARHGVYSESIASSIKAEQLQRYFDRTDSQHFRIKDEVRATLVVGVQNLLTDPSIFSNLDLISCRNMPADLPASTLQRLASRFHFALKDRAWLVLDKGQEQVPTDELFEPVSPEWPVYRRRGISLSNRSIRTGPVTELVRSKIALEAALQVANEKIATMAEELEIACEDVRGSNARLKSVNQELAILNAELQHRVGELNASNHDLTTLLAAIDVAVVFLDGDLHIRRFTDTAARLLNLTMEDLGGTLSEQISELAGPGLGEKVRKVIATGAPSEQEIRSESHRYYLRRVLPYLAGDQPLGAVVTWIEITQAKLLQEEVSGIAALEQQRIGQELHDGTLQELTGLGLLAQNLSESLVRGGEPADQVLAERLARGIAEANQHARALARGLVPVPIDADSLTPALAELARGVQETFGIACSFEQDPPIDISDAGTATHLYRIAQEAVRNAASHSRANRISIALRSSSGNLLLEVRDNGIGIPPRTQMHSGVGLRLMEHRCSLIGGRFTAEPHPDGGTTIACRLPLANGSAPGQGVPS
jgi:signal transduction histidine kinase/chemotaxis methyl-accepting protein methylase